MPIFPLAKPLSDHELLKTTCHLYKTSLLRVLPYSLLCVAIVHFFRYAKSYFPLDWQLYYQQGAMILLVLTLPLISAMITTIDKVATSSTMGTVDVLIETGKRFLSFIGALASMAFVPLVLLGICILGDFVLLYYKMNFNVVFAWAMLSPLLIFASLVSNIYAPWLIASDGLDANEAQSISNLLVKNNFWRTFSHGLFAVLVIVFCMKIPTMFNYYFANTHINQIWVELIAEGLLMIIGPWSLVFLLTNKYDLQTRKKAEINDPDHYARKQKVQSAIPVKKSNNVSF
jgi:hypothetical protein